MNKLKVLPEIKKLLFPLKDEELKLLEESIKKEGIRDPLVVWERDGELILLDGYHRFELAKKYNLEYKIVKRKFANVEEAKLWVLKNQLGRRNLTDEQRTYIIGKIYEALKKEEHRPKKENKGGNLPPFSGHHATAKAIASLQKVDESTVRRASEFAKAVDKVREVNPKVAERVLRGEVKDAKTVLPKIVKEKPEVLPKVVEKIEKGTSKIKEAIKEVRIEEEVKKVQNTTVSLQDFDLRLGDFRKVLSDVEKVDAIITDPPYDREGLPLWDDLGKFAKEKLKEHGYLVAYSGILFLRENLNALSKHLDYVWTFCLYTGSPTTVEHSVNVHNRWNAILVFQKGFTKFPRPVGDYLVSEEPQKDFFGWQKSLEPVKKLVEVFSQPGDLVCDPFFGSGTTAVACKEMKRRFVGAEIKKELVEVAKARLLQAER
ncbi:MAG: DNA methyltransferase [Thermoproteota archaeon]